MTNLENQQLNEMQAEFIADFSERLTSLTNILERIDVSNLQERFPLDLVFRTIHSLKGTAGMFGLHTVGRIAASVESLLTRVRRGAIKVNQDLLELIIESIDEMIALLGGTEGEKAESHYEELVNRIRLLTDQDQIKTSLTSSSVDFSEKIDESRCTGNFENSQKCTDLYKGSEPPCNHSESASVNSADIQSHTGDLSVKVDIGTLDSMMEMISELRSGYLAMARTIRHLPSGLGDRQLKSTLLKASLESRKSISALEGVLKDVRLVPLSILFERFRIEVRRLARMLGKEAEIVIEGGETKIDRALIDKLYNPMLHIIRNAIAHGIETPQERRKAGKPTRGTLVMRAGISANQIRIEVEDDGRGIDADRIVSVARQLGITIGDGDSIFDLLFIPGFTTSTGADEISGRGVGLDAVKREVEKLRGTVELDSCPGKGTSVSLHLPLTMVVSRGLLLEEGDIPLIVPDSDVVQVVKIPQEAQRSGFLKIEGMDVRLICLESLIGATTDSSSKFATIVSAGEKKIGITSSRVLGEIDVVSKPIPCLFSVPSYIDGLAEISDGRAAFILNAGRVGRKCEAFQVSIRSMEQDGLETSGSIFSQGSEMVELVIFRDQDNYYAVPAGLVKQIVRSVRITRVPSLSGECVGIGFIRGECYLLAWAGRGPLTEGNLAKWAIALRVPGNCGLVAEQVERVTEVPKSEITLVSRGSMLETKGQSSKLANQFVEVLASARWNRHNLKIVGFHGTLTNKTSESIH